MTDTTNTSERVDPDTGEIRTEFDAAAADAAAAAAAGEEGQRIRGFIAPKDFLSGRPAEFLDQYTPRCERGSLYTRLGFLVGPVFATAERTHDANGVQLQYGPSIWLEGRFDGIIDVNGELMSSRFAILPKAAGGMIHAVFQQLLKEGQNPSGALNLEIGIEATGKQIAYTYVVTQIMARRPSSVQSQLRARREAALANDQKLLANHTTLAGSNRASSR